MRRKQFLSNLLKLFFALIIGGFLGIKILANGLNNGDAIQIMLFFAICALIGFILAIIGNKRER